MPKRQPRSAAKKSRLTCLFWNLNRSNRDALVAQLAKHADADIVVLAESGGEPATALSQLQTQADRKFWAPESAIARLPIFTRHQGMKEVYGDVGKRLSIRAFQFGQTAFLLVAVHLPSKNNWSAEDQAVEATVLADQIRRIEQEHGHRRTVLIGDLNMNPFEAGVMHAAGLHAMMSRSSVEPGERTVQGRSYPFFYNPMWGFFGDRTAGPAGTFHYRHSGHVSYDWNMFDQILIRPDALPWFHGDVEIITRIGETSLMSSNGRPDPEVGSDHFPILFRLIAPVQ